MSGDWYERMIDAEWDEAEAVYLEQCDPALIEARESFVRGDRAVPPSPEGAVEGQPT